MSDTTKAGEDKLYGGIPFEVRWYRQCVLDKFNAALEHGTGEPDYTEDDNYLMKFIAQERTKLVDELISKLPEKKYMDTWDAHANTVIDQVTQLLKTYRSEK